MRTQVSPHFARYRHGIDLKTHSQCQRSAAQTLPTGISRIRFLFISGVCRCARLAARRQSQQSCALWRTLSRWPLLIRAKSASADFRPDLRGGGAYRDRTDDPLLAKQVLSQLS